MISVRAVEEKCRPCYSCARGCPTGAVQVREGRVRIVEQRCVSCGLCAKRCSRGGLQVRSSLEGVTALLQATEGRPVHALLAPSFPAAFPSLPPERLVGALHEAGFSRVFEAAFGADLVAGAYRRVFQQLRQDRSVPFMLTTTCPAVVAYVEKLHPGLAPCLAPILSPMEAAAKAIRKQPAGGSGSGAAGPGPGTGPGLVFIGPCVAKKEEASRSGLVDEVLTFEELLELFERQGIDPFDAPPRPFSPPRAGLGRISPIAGGLLAAAGIAVDPLSGAACVVNGPERVSGILDDLSRRMAEERPAAYRLFDLLFCEGCFAGPGLPDGPSPWERRERIARYAQEHPPAAGPGEPGEYPDLDLSRSFRPLETEEARPPEEEIRRVLSQTGRLDCKACGYSSCREMAIAVCRGIAEVEMCPSCLTSRLEEARRELQAHQAHRVQVEKLVTVGQMAAGIAHEINNPLGVLLMYAHLLREELEPESQAGRDVEKIIEEAERTRRIACGMLSLARQEKASRQLADINRLVEAAAEGVRGIDEQGRIGIHLTLDESIGQQLVDPVQLRQVFDNVLRNAVEAMPGGGTITIRTMAGNGEFAVHISDTGTGISEESMTRLFTPFYTTRPAGTGLGLAVSHGIVKMHGGSIDVANNPDGGATFTIRIKHYCKEDQVV